MPPATSAPRTEMVKLVLDKMRTQDEVDDRYVIVGSSCSWPYRNLIGTRSSEAVEAFRHVARWIPRSISPFLDVNAAMCTVFSDDEL